MFTSVVLYLAAAWLVAAAGVSSPNKADPRTVNLGYAAYTSVHNASTGLTVWKGIRYAQAPIGKLRWQSPQPPLVANTTVTTTPILADHFGPTCPQSLSQFPGASTLLIPGNEDCLFLNVYAPQSSNGSTDARPVLVWIHGGGYGELDATQDLSGLIVDTNNSIIGVSIQYRLGAFGFLASDEVRRRGRLNAGLLDQRAALQWVQQHIAQFGGDPGRVTIAGESAGAGSVLLHAVANDTGNGKLFQNIFAASPWIPTQPNFDDAISARHYVDFAAAAGCNDTATSVFDCLVAQDSLTLQRASNWVSTTQPTPHGNWAFIPVTDGEYVPGPPSVLLAQGPVHGVNALIGNNADEGVLIVPADIRTESDLRAWLHAYFHDLSDADLAAILAAYPAANNNSTTPGFETDGIHSPTANDVSSAATGVQQRAYNIYAEASVICPSYWLAAAFSTGNRTAFHYQYSVPFAAHGVDLTAYWGPATPNQGPDLVQAFREIIARFVVHGNPSIPAAVANGLSAPPDEQQAPNAATNWPTWSGGEASRNGLTGAAHRLLNLNQTGGTPYAARSPTGAGTVTQYGPPGQRNRFAAADADAWEGGRGERCAFWQRIGHKIPE